MLYVEENVEMENGYGTFSDDVLETSQPVNAELAEPEPCAGPSGLGLFSVKSEAIPQTEAVDQIAELNALCLNVYDQKQFEDGIIEQVESAFQKQEAERQKMLAKKAIFPVLEDIRAVERRIKAIDEMLHMSKSATSNGKETKRLLESINREKTNKLKQLKGLKAKHRALVARAEGEEDVQIEDHVIQDTGLDQETVWHLEKVFGIGSSKPESEHDKLIRSGKMTPFGTVTGEKGGRVVLKAVTDGPTDFEKYLLDQEVAQQQKNQKKPRAAPKIVPAPKRQKVSSKGHINFPADDGGRETELEGLPSTSREHPPLIRKVKVNKKTDGTRDTQTVKKEKESSSSCSEYVPSEDDSSSDGTERKARRKNTGNESDAQSGDDSDSGTKSRKRRRALDDGCYKSYQKRIGIWKKKVLKAKKEETEEEDEEEVELEGGYRIPSSIWNKLYPYQQTCVQWLWELHCQRCGGIVGDEMGLGKTIQIIAYLVGLHNSQLISRDNKFKGLGPVLIVAPTTIMHQWVKEFHAWWPQFRVAVLHESGSHSGTKEALVRNINTTNGVLITSYSGVAIHQVDLMRRDWHYVILDEGHKIRNPDARITLACKQFRTPHRIILSGSPVQNSLKELWSLFDFIFPGKLGTLPVFMQQFAVPITHGGYSNASSVQVQTAYRCAVMLRNTINPYLLRRMKDDVKMNVQLPGRNEQVLFCRLTDHQRELYKEYLDSKEIKSILDGRLQVFVGLINLRKICNHADLYSGGPKVFANTDVEALPDEMRYGYWKRSGKMMVIAAILKLWHRQGHRVLLFSQSKQMLNILEKFVQNQGYTYARMDGSTNISTRQPMIDNFNKDPGIFVFLLTTRVGGLGVNLTGANRVVIYDPDWNPSTDLQARERAWRIGQQRDVTIYRLLTAGTIEEKIYHRQIFKQFLTNRVLKDPRQRRFFKSNDLFELFTLRDDQDAATETGAIFAGTGSEVRVDRTSTKKNPEAENGKSCLSPEKIQRMKELAKALSRKIVERGAETSDVGQAVIAPKKPTKSKRKSRRKSIDGMENLVRSETYKPPPTSESELAKSAAQDDYVLRKLLSKTGVHSALKHDVIVDTSAPDYTLVEAEAERVAREAVRELKRSRRSCLRAEYGVPTWTGNNGASGAPVAPRRPRFGAKKKTAAAAPEEPVERSVPQVIQQRVKKEDKAFSGVVEESKPKALTSSQLLDSIRKRNPVEEDDDAAVVGPRPDTRYDELLVDIRNFVAFQAAVDGQATTEELVERFRARLPAEDSAVFKALLGKVCEFSRCPPMDGVWRLRQEFR